MNRDTDAPIMKADDGNMIQFYWGSSLNEAESKNQGRKVHDKVLMVRILTPGAKQSRPEFEIERHFSTGGVRVNDQYAARYGTQLAKWKLNAESPDLTGTPLDACPWLDVATIANFRALNIRTVDALAMVTDGNLQNLGPGGRTLRDKAKAMLEAAKGGAPVDRLTEENAALNARVADLTAQVAELAKKLDPDGGGGAKRRAA